MPNYEYECENCGPFVENRPMAEFDLPFACPDCGDLAPRLFTCPALAGGASEDAEVVSAPPCGRLRVLRGAPPLERGDGLRRGAQPQVRLSHPHGGRAEDVKDH